MVKNEMRIFFDDMMDGAMMMKYDWWDEWYMKWRWGMIRWKMLGWMHEIGWWWWNMMLWYDGAGWCPEPTPRPSHYLYTCTVYNIYSKYSITDWLQAEFMFWKNWNWMKLACSEFCLCSFWLHKRRELHLGRCGFLHVATCTTVGNVMCANPLSRSGFHSLKPYTWLWSKSS